MYRFLLMTVLLTVSNAFAGSLQMQPILSIDGQELNLEQYKGQAVLVVNIATQCGYTGQLAGLEKLYQEKKQQGFVVLGIPSNDFGSQTPEPEAEVKKFCSLRYGVTFPLTKKVGVKGQDKHPLIRELLAGSEDKTEIAWNFEKFLINKAGKVVGRFGSKVEPQSAALSKAIDQAL